MTNMDADIADSNILLYHGGLSTDCVDPSITMGFNPGTISSPAANLSTNNMQGHLAPITQMSNTMPMPSSASPHDATPSPLSNSQSTSTLDATSQADGVRTRSRTKPALADIQPKPAPFSEQGSDTPEFKPETKARATKPKKAPGRTKRNRGGKRNSLERNRIAAAKCREKKKNWIHDLEDTKSDLEKRHRNLMSEYTSLFDELTELKNTLVAHANCHDSNIDGWINNEAAKYVSRVRRITHATTSTSTEDQESSSLSTPSNANLPDLPLPDNSQNENKIINQFDQNYINNTTVNKDIFMMQSLLV